MPSPVCVFLIGDCRLFTDLVGSVLGRHDTMRLIGSTIEPETAAERLQSLGVDVVLIDAGIESTDVLRLIREIKAKVLGPSIVVLGMQDSEEAILRFIEAGVSGYLLKEASLQELLGAIEAVRQGRTVCSARIAAAVFNRVCRLSQTSHKRSKDADEELSGRQQEILEMLALGLVNKEIAHRLGIAVCTVKNHVHNILDKLRVPHRRAAVRYAREAGMCGQTNGFGPARR
jgi:two-component system nitrate/nitrite response regulator NarL